MSTYNPNNVIMNYGPLPILGFADGSKISVAFQGDGDTVAVGTDGNAVIVRDNNRSAEVTVRLHAATTQGRATLSSLLAQYNGPNIALPLSIVSRDTGEAIVSAEATIKMRPNADFAQEAPVREIVFVCSRAEYQAQPLT